jgi:RNA 2',3'-cyclic 3'-phosphodiesterase
MKWISLRCKKPMPDLLHKRLFIAVPLKKDALQSAFKINEMWKEADQIKWVSGNKLHITLLFIGKVRAEDMGKINAVISGLVIGHPSFELSFEKLLVMSSWKNSKMLWAQYKQNELFINLNKDLGKKLSEEIGFKPEKRNPVPHITLARFKEKDSFYKGEQDEAFPSVKVDAIELWESLMDKEGSYYICIEKWDLA